MFTVANLTQKSLINSARYGFAGFGKKRTPTKNDLAKYDVVVVGSGLGTVLASHLDAVMHEKVKILVSYDQPIHEFTAQRTLYEQGKYSIFLILELTNQIWVLTAKT